MNNEILLAILIGIPEEELIGYYDEEECQCCYDYVSRIDPEEMLMMLEEAGIDWRDLRREFCSRLFCCGKKSSFPKRGPTTSYV